MGDRIRNFGDLRVYQVAFNLQQMIFQVSKEFPKEELYSLTDQIRRSSRSIGANLAEAWHKRNYLAHFLSKLSDSDGEQAETQHWLDTALACKYVSEEVHANLMNQCKQIGRMLGFDHRLGQDCRGAPCGRPGQGRHKTCPYKRSQSHR